MTLADLKALFLKLNDLEAQEQSVRDQLAAAKTEREEAHQLRYSELGLAEVSRPRASAKGRFTATLDGQKRSQNLRLRLDTLRALRARANAKGQSLSETVDLLLESALAEGTMAEPAADLATTSAPDALAPAPQPTPASAPSQLRKPRSSKYRF